MAVGLAVAGGGALLGGALGGYFQGKANKEQAAAAAKAQKAQLAFAREQMANQQRAGDNAAIWMQQGADQGQAALQGAMGAGRNDLMSGYGQGRSDLQSGMASAQGSMSPLLNMAGYAGQAAQGYNPYDLEGKFGSVMANFQADPGYQFRQQQGEEAINRSASARGGRLGARTLKDLMGFNQDLASNEYQNIANRNMAVLSNQAGRYDQAQGMANQNQMNLARMGLTGYGQLAGMQYGAGQDMANMSAQQGGAMAGLGMQGGQSLASLLYGAQRDRGGALLQGAGAAGNIAQGAMQGFGSAVPYAGGGSAATGQTLSNMFGTMGQLGSLYAMNSGATGGGYGAYDSNGNWAGGNQYNSINEIPMR